MRLFRQRTPDAEVFEGNRDAEGERLSLVTLLHQYYATRKRDEFSAGSVRMECGAGQMRFFIGERPVPYAELQFHESGEEILDLKMVKHDPDLPEEETLATETALQLAQDMFEAKPAT